MSRTYRILIVGIVAVLAVGGYYKLLLAPKREKAAALSAEVATAEAQLAQTQSMVATYTGAKQAYQSNYATVVRLGKAIPADDDTRSLLVQLDAAAKRSGIDFDSVDVGAGGASTSKTAGATKLAPGAVNVGSYSAMPFSFGFTGTFTTLEDFFARLERFVTVDGDRISVNGRVLKVESLSLTPAESGWPGLQAQVGASAYIVPEGATPTTDAAATTQSTASSTTTSSTASAGSAGSDLR